MSKLFDGVVGVFLLAWMGLVGWGSWVNAHRLPSVPGNESSLYQSYDPEPVVSKFRYAHESYGGGSSDGAGHLVKSIHHSRSFTPVFTMQADREQALLKALRDDIVLRLKMPGTTATAIHDKPDGGFTYDYTSENSVGSVSVQAPKHRKTVRRYPLPSDLDDVQLTIALEETWTRPASETQWWMRVVD